MIAPPILIKVANNTRPCSKLGGTTLNWREEGSEHYIPQTCDQERFDARKVVFRGSVTAYLQLVEAQLVRALRGIAEVRV